MLKRVLVLTVLFGGVACGGVSSSRDVSAPYFPAIKTDRSVAIDGLRDRAEVLYDDQGVPHIYAKNEFDAMLIQGYLTAQDRFFQMEVIRKASAGRITELFGILAHDETLEADLEMRRIDMTERGTMVFDELAAVHNLVEQARMNAYTRGINAWLAHAKAGRNGAKAPFEYEKNPFIKSQSLDFRDTATWTVADSLAIGRYQQWNLSGSLGDELSSGEKRALVPATVYTETFRFAPVDLTVSIDDFFTQKPAFTGLGSFTALSHLADLTPTEKEAFAAQIRQTLATTKHRGRHYTDTNWPGSNNWVVGPKLTKGNAMLANDPHLSIVNPPLFYNTHLNTARFGKGEWDAIGVTFPGIPGLLIGHNRNLAWGVTTLGYDVMDLYREKLSGKNVAFKGKSVPVAYSKQTFTFGTGKDAKVETVDMPYVPHHGAVVSGQEALAGKKADLITMKWTGRELTTDYRAFFNLLSARDIDDFFAAVHYFDVGAQSFVGADVEGNIGYFGHALVPKREWNLEKYTPDAPLSGEGGYEWTGFLPDGKLVQTKNPAKGYIATANNDIVGTTLDNNPFNDAEYYWFWEDLGFRIARISSLIESLAPVSLEDMEAIQNDTYSLEAERIVPRMLGMLNGVTLPTDVQAAVGYLQGWQFDTPTGIKSEFRTDTPTAEEMDQSIAASIFFRWVNLLRGRILADEFVNYGTGAPGGQSGTKFLIYAIENTSTAAATAHWFDDVATPGAVEKPADLLLVALQDSLDDLTDRFGTADMAQWQWGKLHKVEGPDMVGLITDKSVKSNGPTANNGSQYTVDVAGFDDDFLQTSGSQIRFVAEMKKGAIASRSMIPGGQADDLDSKHYNDQWANWVMNKRLPYRFYDKDIEANVEAKWEFLPE